MKFIISDATRLIQICEFLTLLGFTKITVSLSNSFVLRFNAVNFV